VCSSDLQPQDALPLSSLAVTIADALPHDWYPAVVTAQIRAHAWKDRAQALSFNGRHDEALAAIDHAEQVLEPFGTVAHDRAIVCLVKAAVLQTVNRFDESLGLLHACEEIFQEHGDDRRLVYCGINEANLLYRQQHIEAAYEKYATLLTEGKRTCDTTTLAALHNNMACCLVELGRVTEANIHASEAVAHFNEVGNHVDALRTELATGRMFAAKGKTTEALVRLRRARKNFEDRGLHEEASICGLDLAATLLADSREGEARQIFDEVAGILNPVSERARVALAYLAEQFAAHDATPAAVRHVSEYLQLLKREPTTVFVAPS